MTFTQSSKLYVCSPSLVLNKEKAHSCIDSKLCYKVVAVAGNILYRLVPGGPSVAAVSQQNQTYRPTDKETEPPHTHENFRTEKGLLFSLPLLAFLILSFPSLCGRSGSVFFLNGSWHLLYLTLS